MELAQAIAAFRVVALDTNIFIYAYQEHSRYLPIIRPIFARLDTDLEFRVITSIITLIEVIAQPLRLRRNDLVTAYTTALLNSAKVWTMPVDAIIARRAAELRAQYNLRTPDAIQIATALVAGAQAVITNDRQMKNVSEISILIVDDFAR
ncbi:MAG: PIN domain-containing protein [Anaerolineae bacterium]|nr:PIN domain-containing protein [Anaerolineae bacterium]